MRTFAALVVASLLVTTGCRAVRTLKITSEPEGAVVRLDDKTIGTTPMKVPFEYYGRRRVTLYREGFQTHSEQIDLRAPWYARFPLDIVSEVLLPFGWKDKRHLHVDMIAGNEEMSLPDLRSVFDRAEALRRAGPKGPQALPEIKAREVPAAEDEEEAPEAPERPER